MSDSIFYWCGVSVFVAGTGCLVSLAVSYLVYRARREMWDWWLMVCAILTAWPLRNRTKNFDALRRYQRWMNEKVDKRIEELEANDE